MLNREVAGCQIDLEGQEKRHAIAAKLESDGNPRAFSALDAEDDTLSPWRENGLKK
jgi:hypothetical protein